MEWKRNQNYFIKLWPTTFTTIILYIERVLLPNMCNNMRLQPVSVRLSIEL